MKNYTENKIKVLVELAQSIKFDLKKPLRYYVILAKELEERV